MTSATGRIAFKPPNPGSLQSVQIMLIPFVYPGLEIASIHVRSSIDERTIRVPNEGTSVLLAVDQSGFQELYFECDSFGVPSASGFNSDMRSLCLKLIQIDLIHG